MFFHIFKISNIYNLQSDILKEIPNFHTVIHIRQLCPFTACNVTIFLSDTFYHFYSSGNNSTLSKNIYYCLYIEKVQNISMDFPAETL